MLIVTFMLAIGASGWNIMGGYAGYLSLGNSVFIGLGAYTTGILAAKDHVSPFLAASWVVWCRRGRGAAQPRHAAHAWHVLRDSSRSRAATGRHRGHDRVRPDRRQPGLALPLRPGVCPIRTGRSTIRCSPCSW